MTGISGTVNIRLNSYPYLNSQAEAPSWSTTTSTVIEGQEQSNLFEQFSGVPYFNENDDPYMLEIVIYVPVEIPISGLTITNTTLAESAQIYPVSNDASYNYYRTTIVGALNTLRDGEFTISGIPTE